MCGITLIQKFKEKDKVNINNILNSMRNRGPDDQQYEIVKIHDVIEIIIR